MRSITIIPPSILPKSRADKDTGDGKIADETQRENRDRRRRQGFKAANEAFLFETKVINQKECHDRQRKRKRDIRRRGMYTEHLNKRASDKIQADRKDIRPQNLPHPVRFAVDVIDNGLHRDFKNVLGRPKAFLSYVGSQ